MRPIHIPLAVALVLSLAIAPRASAADARLASPATLQRDLGVRDVVRGRDVVTATLVNDTTDEIRDVQLLVLDQFLWRNERHPGGDDPGVATPVTVPGPVPPHGTLAVRATVPVLPARTDGTFDTRIDVLGFARQPVR